MGYIEALAGFCSTRQVFFSINEDIIPSFPVITRKKGAFCTAVFFYKMIDQENSRFVSRPQHWMLLSTDDDVVFCGDCRIIDFINKPEQYPLGEKHPFSIIPTEPQIKQFTALFEDLRRMAFKAHEELDEGEKETLKNYQSMFEEIVDPVLKPFYFALAPDFFDWIGIKTDESSKPDGSEQVHTATPISTLNEQLILERLDNIISIFNDKLKYDAHKEKLFDNMHQELQQYKKGLLDKIILEMAMDVIKVVDDIAKTSAVYREKEGQPEDYQKLLKMFGDIGTDLNDILFRQSIEAFSVAGDAVDVSKQKIVNLIETNDMALDKKICKRIAEGYEKEGRVIRHEKVSVYVFKEGI